MDPSPPRYTTDRIVNSVEEAVALAGEWKRSGRFDWFRGQSRTWALKSSMSRLGNNGIRAGKERLIRFARWAEKCEGLGSINKNSDALLAVAQHYGLPTHFIDFTPDLDVAAFFATHGKDQHEGEYACLICISSAEYLKKINSHAQAQDSPRANTISLHVPDLWRLQAQRGVFLEMPYANIEEFYPTQRILFPFTSKWSRPPEDHIYPTKKSRLELVLDHYFELERLQRRHEEITEWVESLKLQGREIHKVRLRKPQGFLPDYVDSRKVSDLPRWSVIEVETWLRSPDEYWDEVVSLEEISIFLPSIKDAELGNALHIAVMAAIGRTSDLRRKLCKFQLLDSNQILSSKDRERLESLCAHLWDGMRTLPYSMDQIAKVLSETLRLELTIDRERLYNGQGWRGVLEPVIPDLQKVGLSMPDGTGGAAFLSQHAFRKALRPQLSELLLPDHKGLIDRPSQLLQVITAPEILFELNDLVELFSNYLIPTQAVVYGLDQPLLISPVSLMSFGAP